MTTYTIILDLMLVYDICDTTDFETFITEYCDFIGEKGFTVIINHKVVDWTLLTFLDDIDLTDENEVERAKEVVDWLI